MTKSLLAALFLLSAAGPPPGRPIPPGFASVGEDRRAIEALLAAYAAAVSGKDQARFESLLLGKDIPFRGIGPTVATGASARSMAGYEQFRRAVFQGPPFTQRFQDVRVEQDGALANVSLVFVNSAAGGQSWGWKTMLLLKVGGRWRIASEFYTGHPG